MQNKTFFKGALILIICNLIGKIFGAVYRIPLANIVGGVGIGQYQLIFPLYCLILTISTSGIPVAISKLVAEYNSKNQHKNSKKLLKHSITILSIISLICTIFVVIFARNLAKIQGNPEIYFCYYAIAPAILFVGVLSAYRGYFQGNMLMFPTAISGLVEQVFKLIFGLFLANKFLVFGVEYAVLGAVIGVSISEFFAFLFLYISYLFYSKKKRCKSESIIESTKILNKKMLRLAVPITLGGLIGPATAMVDSFLVINLLMLTGFSTEVATTMLGLQSGVVEPLINIPVIIAVSISTALIPNISSYSVNESKEEIKKLVEKAFQITLSISITCFIFFIIFGKQALDFLYGSSFDANELLIALKLLYLGAFNIIFLSMVQVSAGVLQGIGLQKYPVKSLIVGCFVKIIFDMVLITIPVINIYGTIISAGICYIIVFLLNYKKIRQVTFANLFSDYLFIAMQSALVCVVAWSSNLFFCLIFQKTLALIVSGFVAVGSFLITYYVFFMRRTKRKNNYANL